MLVLAGYHTQADALTMRYRLILKKIVDAKTKMGETMRTSAFALTQAKYVAGEGVKHTVLDSVETANVKVGAEVQARPLLESAWFSKV